MGGTPNYVWRDGQRLTPYMLYQVNRLDADCRRLFGVGVIVSSAIRLHEEQKAIFLARYTRTPNGRRVYDTRWWNGQLWYRVSAAGTVAQPGTSNHEVQGNKAAVDLRDTGRDGGLATAGSARSNWLRQNAHHYDMIPSGFSFGEAWHYDINNIWNTPPGPAAPPPPPPPPPIEEDDMLLLRIHKLGKGAHLVALGPGTFRHFIGSDPFEKIKNLSRIQDDWQDVDAVELPALLRTYGCDLNIWDWDERNGFRVYDPVDGSLKGGNVWTLQAQRARETQEHITRVLNELTAKLAK